MEQKPEFPPVIVQAGCAEVISAFTSSDTTLRSLDIEAGLKYGDVFVLSLLMGIPVVERIAGDSIGTERETGAGVIDDLKGGVPGILTFGHHERGGRPTLLYSLIRVFMNRYFPTVEGLEALAPLDHAISLTARALGFNSRSRDLFLCAITLTSILGGGEIEGLQQEAVKKTLADFEPITNNFRQAIDDFAESRRTPLTERFYAMQESLAKGDA